MDHAGDNNGYDDQGNYQRIVYVPGSPNVMTDGDAVVRSIQSGKGATLQIYITSPINRQPAGKSPAGSNTLSIQKAYIRRFGNNTPNATLPTE